MTCLKKRHQSRDKRILVIIIATIVMSLIGVSCREEHVAPINQLVKDLFCFKKGSEWTYYDSISQTTQKMIITKYETLKFGGGKSKRGKIYDFAEDIEMEFTVENTSQLLSVKGSTWLKADIGHENTLNGMYISTPIIDNTLRCTEFSLSCDENNNFHPSVTYLSTYMVNEITYSDIYVFNKDHITYYVSKHIGFIRCVYSESGYRIDLVLIDKNVKQ